MANSILQFHLNQSKEKLSAPTIEEVFVINSSQCNNGNFKGKNLQIGQDEIKIKREADELFLNCIKHEIENEEEEEKQENKREVEKDLEETFQIVKQFDIVHPKLEIKCEPEICYPQELTTMEEGITEENGLTATQEMQENNYLQKSFAVLCSFCQRTFHVAQNLQLHMTGTKYKIQCKFCSERLVDSENLALQKTTHIKLSTRCSSRENAVVVDDARKNEVPTIGMYSWLKI